MGNLNKNFNDINPSVAEQFDCFVTAPGHATINHVATGISFTLSTVTIAQAATLEKAGYNGFITKKEVLEDTEEEVATADEMVDAPKKNRRGSKK